MFFVVVVVYSVFFFGRLDFRWCCSGCCWSCCCLFIDWLLLHLFMFVLLHTYSRVCVYLAMCICMCALVLGFLFFFYLVFEHAEIMTFSFHVRFCCDDFAFHKSDFNTFCMLLATTKSNQYEFNGFHFCSTWFLSK